MAEDKYTSRHTGQEIDDGVDTANSIKTAVQQIFASLGNYAFPNGKPEIDWGGGGSLPSYSVAKVIGTGLSASGGDTDVEFGQPLEVTISIINDLYIVDEENIQVTMGGSPVSGAYNASTGKIYIAAVMGIVTINVPSLTYVNENNNLVFQLDCKHRGGQAGHWIDLIGNVDFALTDVMEADTGMVFNGTSSKGVASGGLDVSFETATIEIVATLNPFPSVSGAAAPILSNTLANKVAAKARCVQSQGFLLKMIACSSTGTGLSSPVNTAFRHSSNSVVVCATKDKVYVDGQELSDPRHINGGAITYDITDYVAHLSSEFSIGYQKLASNQSEIYMNGTIMAIRVYNTRLTLSQMQRNHALDVQRFNLS